MRRAALYFLVSLFVSCGSGKSPTGGKGSLLKIGTPSVVVAAAASREIAGDLRATGKTVLSDRFVAKAPADGKIDRIFVEEGQQVNAGDPLVKFADSDVKLKLDKARADQREADAGLADVNFQQTNKDKLVEEGKLSDVDLQGLDERKALYEATIDRAKEEITVLERALENIQINSPIAGLVTKRNASEQMTVQEGDTLLEVVKLSPIHFAFSVPVEVAAGLEKSGEIEVHFPAFPGQTFSGEVLSVGAEIGEKKGVEIKLVLANDNGILKGEMEGEILLKTSIKKKVFAVPPSAIERTERSAYLYRLEGDRVKKIPVDSGEEIGGQTVITKGVKEGDLIVISSDTKLKDGQKVEVRKPS